MSDKVIIQHGDQWLALTLESYQEALQRGSQLAPCMDSTSVQNADDTPVWLSVPQVARLCNISETHLYDEIRLGHVRARRFGRAVRIHRDFVEHQTGHLDRIDGAGE
jgi:excisionase family DNA binding protein